MSTDLKQPICDALAAFIAKRPGLEFGNYGNVTSYRAEQRAIARDKRDAQQLLEHVRTRDSITSNDIVVASIRAFSGRLTINPTPATHQDFKLDPTVTIDYCAGQYYPTEYRKAVCAVLAYALWADTRDHRMPKPEGKLTRVHGPFKTTHDNIEGMTPGDWLRHHFLRRFGRGLQSRWFR